MVIREHYLKKIRPFYDSNLVKVLIGVPYSGKSTLLGQINDEIAKTTDNIISFSFKQPNDFLIVHTRKQLYSYVKEHRKAGKCYVFLDDIEEVEDYVSAIKDLRLDDCSVFMTISNEKGLKEGLYNHLSGRLVTFTIRLFVYKEILEYCKLTHQVYS